MNVHSLTKRVLREVPGVDIANILDTCNRCVREIYRSRRWTFRQKRSRLYLMASESASSGMSVTNGSTTVTVATASWGTLPDYMRLRVNGGDSEYIVQSNTSTSLTLDRAYEGATDADASYILDAVYVEIPSDCWEISRVEEDGGNQLRNPDDYYGEVPFGASDIYLRFDDAPSTDTYYNLWYYRSPVEVTAPTSTIDLPDYMDDLIVYYVITRVLMRQIGNKDPQKVGYYKSMYEEAMRDAKAQDYKHTDPRFRNSRVLI